MRQWPLANGLCRAFVPCTARSPARHVQLMNAASFTAIGEPLTYWLNKGDLTYRYWLTQYALLEAMRLPLFYFPSILLFVTWRYSEAAVDAHSPDYLF